MSIASAPVLSATTVHATKSGEASNGFATGMHVALQRFTSKLDLVEKQIRHPHGRDYAGEFGEQAIRQRVANFGDTDRSKVERHNIESGVRGSLEDLSLIHI